MKKIKKILLAAGIIFVVFIGLIIAIPVMFKGKILNLVKNEANASLNAKLEFKDLDLSLIKSFPSLNVSLEELCIVGVDDFSNDTLVYLKKLSTDVNLMSVISGNQIKVNAIVLDHPKINVIVLKGGKANYDIAKPDTTPTQTDTSTSSSSFSVGLKKFEIIAGNIVYDDADMDVFTEIKNMNMKMKGDLTEKITALDILATIDSFTVAYESVPYLKKVFVKLDSKMDADMEGFKFTFKENNLAINKIDLGFDGFVAMPDSNIDMDLTFKAKQTEFKQVLSLIPAIYAKDFEGVKTSGEFKFDGYAKGRYNSVELPAFGIHLLVNNARFQYPDLPKSVENINMDVKVENPGDYDINIVDVNKMHMEIAQNPIDAVLHVKTSKNDVALAGDIKASLDLESVKDVVPLEEGMTLTGNVKADVSFAGNLSALENEKYDEFKAQGSMELNNINTTMQGMPPVLIEKTVLVFSPKFAELQAFDSKVGKSDFHLTGRMDNVMQYVFKGDLLKAKFDFSSNLLDVNEFLTGEETPTEPAATDTSTLTAFEVPSNVDFVLNSNLKKVIYDKIEITDIIGMIMMRDSKLSLSNLKMNLLKGSVLMTGSYDSKNIRKPFADFNMDLSNIDIQSAFKAFNTVQKLAPIAKNCNGNITAGLKIATELDYYMNPVFATTNGSGSFKSDNISMNNSKLFDGLATMTRSEKFRNPTLKNVDIKFKIVNGNIEIEPTKFKMAETETSFQGTTNLDQRINYNLGMKLPSGLANTLVKNIPLGNKNANEVEIFAQIGGTLTEPKILKLNSTLTEGLTNEVKEKVEEVKDNLKEEAKKYLEQANEQAQKLIDEAKAKRDQLISESQKQAENVRTAAKTAGEKLVSEADEQGKNLVSKAGNPIAKKVAEESAKKLKAEAEKKAEKLNSEANEKANGLVDIATKSGDKLVQEAEQKADKIKAEAQEKVKKM